MLYVVAILWMAVGLVWPSGPARLIPRRQLATGTFGWCFVGGLSLVWVAIWWSFGSDMAMPGQDGTPLSATFALVLGGPAAWITYRVWRTAQMMALKAARRPWQLPALDTVPLAVDVTGPTPLPRGPQLGPWEAHRTDRGLRRARAVLVALIVLLVWCARALRLFGTAEQVQGADPAPGQDTGAIVFLLILGALVLLFVVRAFLRHRHHRGSRALSIPTAVAMNGWTRSAQDGPDLVRAFPTSPVLRPLARGDRVRQDLTVHATNGRRRWWAVQQNARMSRRRNQLATPDTRSTWLLWMPGVRLAPVLVTGRDNVRVQDWFTGSVRLESELFNRRLFVYTIRGAERDAFAVLHPRMMELLLRCMPDGATLLVQDDWICVWRDGPMHGTDLCTHASLVLQVADLVPGFLLTDRLTAEAGRVRAFAAAAGSGGRPRTVSAPAMAQVLVSWVGSRTFQSDQETARRVGEANVPALVDYLYEVRCTVDAWLAAHAGQRPLRLLVSIGLHARGAPGYWCESVVAGKAEPLSTAELDALVAHLRTVPATVPAEDPVAFALAVAVNDPAATEDDFPQLPTPWADASAAAGRPLAVPDELFDWLWSQPPVPAS